ncbi:MAG: tRNA 2-thiouridine(34) synthase MnmA [Pseudomonadota bacterium]
MTNSPKVRDVAVAMSGGVDSFVAAALLIRQGYRVTGLHALLHAEKAPEGLDLARQAAQRLSIALHVVDLRVEFRTLVVEPFVAAYLAGRTPNPCFTCNPLIKFGLLAERAREELCGAGLLATGHYARIGKTAGGEISLLRAADHAKDQSYFLALVPRDRLRDLLFPLGDLTKAAVREMAQKTLGLRDGLPRESQDVCFLAGGDYRALLAGGEDRPGDIVDLDGRVLGRHQGLWRFTVGQRRGIGVAAPRPLYVRALDVAGNRLVVAAAGQAPFGFMTVGRVNQLCAAEEELHSCRAVRTRYRQREQGCTVSTLPDGRLRVEFAEPQQAVSVGQGAVFHQGERVLAGGIIEEAG